jgi:ClpP class serine protease
MNKFSLIKALAQGVFMVTPEYLVNLFPSVDRLMKGEPVAFYSKEEEEEIAEKMKPVALFMDANNQIQSYTNFADAPKGSVAVIRMDGPVMKDDYCGAPGTSTISKYFDEAYSSPNISAVIFRSDSGGGAVNGTMELGLKIQQKNKPVIGFVDGLSASASYLVMSHCDYIYASSANAMIGSIGVATSYRSYTEYLNKIGIKEGYVVADGSEDKNASYFKMMEGDSSAYKAEVLNPIKENFHATIKANRGDKLKIEKKSNEPLTGKVYIAQDAIGNGLIDAIGSFEDAIAKANNMASTKTQTTKIENMKIAFVMAWASIGALLGFKEGDQIGAEEMEKINGELGSHLQVKADLESVNANVNKLNGELQTAKADLKTAQDALAAEKLAFETYKKGNPGATTVETTAEGDEGLDTNKDELKLTYHKEPEMEFRN